MRPTLLITGGSGYVGQAVCRQALEEGYAVVATFHRRPPALPGVTWEELDLAEEDAAPRLVARLRPDVVIHAAAAWQTPESAQAVIVDGTRRVATAAAGVGARLVHMSTDMIFDGEHAPYREDDPPHPVSFYGRAKVEAEACVAATLADHVIVRTSLVTCFDPPDPRTAQVLAALAGDLPLVLFTDEFRCPVRTEDLARALVELAGHSYRGRLHVAGPERLSRHALGLRIAAWHGLDGSRLAAGSAAASGLVRPRDCSLDITLAQSILKTPLRPLL